jgi:CRP-like cAMP-binding protein
MVALRRGFNRTAVEPSASKLDTLRSTVELAACSPPELRSLLQYFDEVTVPHGTRIAVKGQLSSQFVIVAEGRLKAGSPDDGWHSLVPGDTAGWSAMWEMAANEATVVAETETRLLVMGHAQFRAVKAVVERPARVLAAKGFLRSPIQTSTPRESTNAIAG